MVSAVRGGWWWCGAVRCCGVCLGACERWCCARQELGRFQIAILGPLSRERGGGAFLPGACLLLATVDGLNGSNRAWRSRMGNRSSKLPAALLCLCYVRLCWVDVLWPTQAA